MDKTTTDTRNKGWEPKDGDVCFLSAKHNHLIIFREIRDDVIVSRVNITYNYVKPTTEGGCDVCNIKDIVEFRPATDLERLELFHNMMKEGKMWDAENKRAVDYPMWKGNVKTE